MAVLGVALRDVNVKESFLTDESPVERFPSAGTRVGRRV